MAPNKAESAVKPPSFRNLMTFRLHMVARHSERISEQYYRKHMDLSLPECRVIGVTAGYGSVSFKRVAAEANLEKSYASRVVSALVERDIIARLANPADSRSVLLELTDNGRNVHQQMYQLALQLNAQLQAPFRRKQVTDFMQFLTTLEQVLGRGEELIEGRGDWPGSSVIAAAPDLPTSAADLHIALDQGFARRLHDLLGEYLKTQK